MGTHASLASNGEKRIGLREMERKGGKNWRKKRGESYLVFLISVPSF